MSLAEQIARVKEKIAAAAREAGSLGPKVVALYPFISPRS